MRKVFLKIKEFIQYYFLGKSFEFFKANSGIAVKVVNQIKSIVEHPLTDIAIDLIPSDLDKAIHNRLKAVLPTVALKLALAHQILQNTDKPSVAIESLIAYLKTLNKEARIGFWILFAGELNIALSDGELTLSEGIALTQMVYTEYKLAA